MDKQKKRDEITDALMQQPGFGERLMRGLSGMFLSTPYPDQNRPTDLDAPMRGEELIDAYEEDRKKRGSYGLLK